MNAQQLRNSILQQAIQGKLVPQDPNDEPASVLLQRIRKEKERLVKEGKLKKKDLESKPIEEDEIPFEVPESWEWVRLGEISTYSHTKKKINASKADPHIWGLDLEDIEKGGRLLCIKTVEERNACDRERANDETDEHERIPLRHAAELIDFSDARGVGNRIAAHKEQGFKQNITESVRRSAVHAHRRADTRARDHVTDLADNMIGEQLNHIVFHDGVCCAVKCHQDADAD